MIVKVLLIYPYCPHQINQLLILHGTRTASRGKSLSRWVRNRDSWRLPRQIAIFGICRDISRQYTFSAISRDFLWFSTSDCDFIHSLTVKFLGFLPSEADLTSRYRGWPVVIKSWPVVIEKLTSRYRKVDQSLYPLIMQIWLPTRRVICLHQHIDNLMDRFL